MNKDVKNVTLTCDINSVNIILAGLGKLPLEASLATYELVHKQVNEQIKTEPKSSLEDKIIKE